MFLIYCNKTMGQEHGVGRELRHTYMVYGVRDLVKKNAMEKTCRHIRENKIKVDIWQIFCFY